MNYFILPIQAEVKDIEKANEIITKINTAIDCSRYENYVKIRELFYLILN